MKDVDLTPIVEAAARAVFEENRAAALATAPDQELTSWEDTNPFAKNVWREHVLTAVTAAIDALPDQRYATWVEGHLAPNNAVNPYPSGV